jgi:hypothetical protein
VSPDLLDTFARARQACRSVSEPPSTSIRAQTPAGEGEDPSARPVLTGAAAGFERSTKLFGELVEWAAGDQARALEHSELETRLVEDCRELTRVLLQEHLDLRAQTEQRTGGVIGADSVPRRNVERGHERDLHSVFGEVEVRRLAYRARGRENLYVADAQLNLPAVKHSHGLRRLAALEAPRTSFEDAQAAILRQTGQQLGKRQLRELAVAAARDITAFYEGCGSVGVSR